MDDHLRGGSPILVEERIVRASNRRSLELKDEDKKNFSSRWS